MARGVTAFAREIEIAVRLARAAAVEILRVYHTDFVVNSKGADGPVTEADRGANALIVAGLRAAFPDDAVIAEETPAVQGSATARRIWYVDPMDGTAEFVNRNGEFSAMIGLAIDGQARLGVVYQPVTGLLYAGVAEVAAWSEAGGERRPLRVSDTRDLRRLRLAVSRSHRSRLIDAVRRAILLEDEIRCGSVGLKVGLVAAARADAYVEPSPNTSAWDACAPEAIVRGAGGRFTDLDGAPVRYDAAQLKNRRGLVASNGACHDALIQTLAAIVRLPSA